MQLYTFRPVSVNWSLAKRVHSAESEENDTWMLIEVNMLCLGLRLKMMLLILLIEIGVTIGLSWDTILTSKHK